MDKQQADAIITEYMKKIYGFALTETKDIDLAEELAATITFEVYKSLLKSDIIYNVNSYIYRISQNVYARFIMEESKLRQSVDSEDLRKSEISNTDWDEETISQDKTHEKIRKEIAYLSNLQREIVVLHYFDKIKIKDIAEKLELPLGTVCWHLKDARNQIKESFISPPMRYDWGSKGGENKKHNINLANMGHCGYLGSYQLAPSFYINKKLTQHIVFTTYQKAKSTIDIAKELEVPVSFIEDEISHLLENNFIEKTPGNKYRTTIYMIDKREQEKETKINDILKKYAKIVCEMYVPLVKSQIESIQSQIVHKIPQTIRDIQYSGKDKSFPSTNSTTPYIYTPKNDINFLLWSMITFACGKKLNSEVDENDLMKYCINRKDGGKYITISNIEFNNNANDDSNVELQYKSFFHDTYPFFLYRYDSYLDNRKDKRYTNNYEILFDFINGKIPKEPTNIYKYILLYDNGLIVNQNTQLNSERLPKIEKNKVRLSGEDFINMILTTIKYNYFIFFLPEMPKKLKDLSIELDHEMYKINNNYYPSHLQDLCKVFNKNILSIGNMRMHILENLLKSGILKPLKKHQKQTVNMIMFMRG